MCHSCVNNDKTVPDSVEAPNEFALIVSSWSNVVLRSPGFEVSLPPRWP